MNPDIFQPNGPPAAGPSFGATEPPVNEPPKPLATPDTPLAPTPVTPSTPAAPAMTAPQPTIPAGAPTSQAVINVLSPYGVEYVFLTILLFIAGGSITGLLLLLVNGQTGFELLSLPVGALVVALPLLAFLFLRLKKLELRMPELKLDGSKRRSTQFTKIVAFTICVSTLIAFVVSIFAKMGGQSVDILKFGLNSLCVLVVAGGVLAYYWFDEHRGLR